MRQSKMWNLTPSGWEHKHTKLMSTIPAITGGGDTLSPQKKSHPLGSAGGGSKTGAL